MKLLNNQKGAAHLLLAACVIVVLGVGGASYFVYTHNIGNDELASVDGENIDDGTLGYTDDDTDDGADVDNESGTDGEVDD